MGQTTRTYNTCIGAIDTLIASAKPIKGHVLIKPEVYEAYVHGLLAAKEALLDLKVDHIEAKKTDL